VAIHWKLKTVAIAPSALSLPQPPYAVHSHFFCIERVFELYMEELEKDEQMLTEMDSLAAGSPSSSLHLPDDFAQ
jgi:hypothetical protein